MHLKNSLLTILLKPHQLTFRAEIHMPHPSEVVSANELGASARFFRALLSIDANPDITTVEYRSPRPVNGPEPEFITLATKNDRAGNITEQLTQDLAYCAAADAILSRYCRADARVRLEDLRRGGQALTAIATELTGATRSGMWTAEIDVSGDLDVFLKEADRTKFAIVAATGFRAADSAFLQSLAVHGTPERIGTGNRVRVTDATPILIAHKLCAVKEVPRAIKELCASATAYLEKRGFSVIVADLEPEHHFEVPVALQIKGQEDANPSGKQ